MTEPPQTGIAQSRPRLRPGLRIWDVVNETYGRVFIENLGFLPKAALAPALAIVALSFLLQAVGLYFDPTLNYDSKETGADPVLAQLPAQLAGLVLYLPAVVFAVPCIRLILLGAETAPPPLQPQWSGVHWRVLGHGVVAALGGFAALIAGGLVLIVISAVFGALGAPFLFRLLILLALLVGFLGVLAFAAATFVRLLLPIPALLAGQAQPTKALWQKSRGHNAALALALLLVSLPLLVVGFVPFALAGGGFAALIGEAPYPLFYDPDGPYFPLLVLWGAVQELVSVAVYAAFIAIVYRTLFEGQGT